MHKNTSLGRGIAFIISLFLVYLAWGRDVGIPNSMFQLTFGFRENTTGSNVVLSVAVAIIFILWFTRVIGRKIDLRYFFGKSKSHAEDFHGAEMAVRKASEVLKRVKRNKKDAELITSLRAQLKKVTSEVKASKAHWEAGDEILKSRSDALKKHTSTLMQSIDFLVKRHPKAAGGGTMGLIILLAVAFYFREMVIEPYQIPSGSMIPTLLIGDHLFVSKLSYGLKSPWPFKDRYWGIWQEPKPGDIVVFKAPNYVRAHAGWPWVKRIIATQGQRVRIQDGQIFVDGKAYKQINPQELVEYPDFYDRGYSAGWETEEAWDVEEVTGTVKHTIYQATERDARPGVMNWPVPGMRKMPGLECGLSECKVKKDHIFVMGDNRGHSDDSRFWGAVPMSHVKGKAQFIWVSVDGSEIGFKLGRFMLPRFRLGRTFKLL